MKDSTIQWTDHTFNPWIGCAKVHTGCKHCYAEALMAERFGRVVWGPDGTRRRTSAATWKSVLRWNAEAELLGVRRRVFCASLADVFEDRPELQPWRQDLFSLIDATPDLDWLLLTKRPENVPRMWQGMNDGMSRFAAVNGVPDGVRHNVWIGTSVSDMETACKQIDPLMACHQYARRVFLSVEPLLGHVDLNLSNWARQYWIDWVIVGGESGPHARPCELGWIEDIVRDAREGAVATFVKQLGSNCHDGGRPYKCADRKGGNPGEWPDYLRVREFPDES